MAEEKKDLFNKRNRNIIYTVIFLVVFLFLFFKNNSFEDRKTGLNKLHYNQNIAIIEKLTT